MGKVREVGEAYSIPCYEREGVEADDLIASLTKQARAKGYPVVIVSADKDLLQLVGDGVWMLDTMKQRAFGPEETKEKLGVRPEQVRDYLALVGDSSDNVPGVPSVGPKTAVELLTQYRQPRRRLRAPGGAQEEGAQGQARGAPGQLAYLSRDLVTLKDDYELELDEQKLSYGGWDDEVLRKFVKHYGFTRLIDQLGPAKGSRHRCRRRRRKGRAVVAGRAACSGGQCRGARSRVEAPHVEAPVSQARSELAPAPLVLRVVQDASELPAIAQAIESAGRVLGVCGQRRQ